MSDPPYCNSQHHFLTSRTLMRLWTSTSVKWRGISTGKTCFYHKNQSTLRTSLP